jgi:hypothetical protein
LTPNSWICKHWPTYRYESVSRRVICRFVTNRHIAAIVGQVVEKPGF